MRWRTLAGVDAVSNPAAALGIPLPAMHAAAAVAIEGSTRLFPTASHASLAPARPDPDRAHLDAAVRGDVGAFQELYRRHAGRIHGVLRRLSGHDNARAEDWTQEAFVLAWQRLASFRGESRFGTWLHRLAVNVALMSLRSTRRGDHATSTWEEEDDIAERAGVEGVDHALRLDLAEAIAALPPRARAILVLHDIEGWKHEEIGQELGIAVGTSKAQLHRARSLVRKTLEPAP